MMPSHPCGLRHEIEEPRINYLYSRAQLFLFRFGSEPRPNSRHLNGSTLFVYNELLVIPLSSALYIASPLNDHNEQTVEAMTSTATPNNADSIHSDTYWHAQIDTDLEARDSTPGRQAQTTPTIPPTMSGDIQSETQFGDSASEGQEEEARTTASATISPVPSPRPSFISIPPRWSFPNSASSGQPLPQEPQDAQTDPAFPIQRRPSLLARASTRLSSTFNTIRIMSPPSPDDTAKLQQFHAAVTSYGTLSMANAAPTPTHLRPPAPPDPSPVTTMESVPPSRAGSEVGSHDGWFGNRLSVRRCGKERDRGSSTALITADPDQLDAESPYSPPATPVNDINANDNNDDRNDETNNETIRCKDKRKGPSISFATNPATNEHDLHTETDKWRNSIPQSHILPPPHHSSPPPTPNAFSKKAASFIAVLERFKPEPAMVLENSGSVARDHLACERTYLAYVRTGLASASTGVGT